MWHSSFFQLALAY
uniref:Uncharacterized protein n=1 Tax=Arundo donax TaxID=35708 RepID=A0A0A9GHH9_ARUDO